MKSVKGRIAAIAVAAAALLGGSAAAVSWGAAPAGHSQHATVADTWVKHSIAKDTWV